jgi:hypothetical protein
MIRFFKSDETISQDFPVASVDPVKLSRKLASKFGNGSFEVHVRSQVVLRI